MPSESVVGDRFAPVARSGGHGALKGSLIVAKIAPEHDVVVARHGENGGSGVKVQLWPFGPALTDPGQPDQGQEDKDEDDDSGQQEPCEGDVGGTAEPSKASNDLVRSTRNGQGGAAHALQDLDFHLWQVMVPKLKCLGSIGLARSVVIQIKEVFLHWTVLSPLQSSDWLASRGKLAKIGLHVATQSLLTRIKDGENDTKTRTFHQQRLT